MSRTRVLYVEDDQKTGELVKEYLASEGFHVDLEIRGDHALKRILAETFDCVLLDIGLPGIDGLEICRKIRHVYPGAIMMLTARGEESDEVIGLDTGADDYLPKPVQPRLLLARLRALVRRSQITSPGAGAEINVGKLRVDMKNRTVVINEQRIEFTSTEFDLLAVLAQQAGSVVTRSDLHLKVRGVRYDGLDRSIDLMIARIRRKIGDGGRDAKMIKSVHGTGYLLVVEA